MRFASSTSCAAVSSSTLADVLQEKLERVRRRLERRASRRPALRRPRLPPGTISICCSSNAWNSSSSCPASRSKSSKASAISSAVTRAVLATRFDQSPRLVRVENVVDALRRRLNLAQTLPHPSRLPLGTYRVGSVAVVSDSRHRPNGSSFDHLVLTFSRRLSRARASRRERSISGLPRRPTAVPGGPGRTPRARSRAARGGSEPFARAENGARAAPGAEGDRRAVLVVEADGRGDLGVGVAGRGSRGGARTPARRTRAPALLEAHAADEPPLQRASWRRREARLELRQARAASSGGAGRRHAQPRACRAGHASPASTPGARPRRPAASRARGRD